MKKNKKEILMITVMILVLIIGITYAYFKMRESINISEVISGFLDMTFEQGSSELILDKATPIYDEDIDSESSYITFNITNTGNINMYTEIYFKDIVMDKELKTYDFKWRVEDITEEDVKIINEGTFLSVKEDKKYLVSNQKIEPSETRNYKVRIWVQETGKDQSRLDSKSFNGKIAASAYSREVGGVPNEPKLAEGLIPVVYDWNNDVWIKAGGEHYWYDYDNQMWANVVTVAPNASDCESKNNCVDNATKHDRTYYIEAEPGTEISMDDINTMWVWIPRYKYNIPSNIGSSIDVQNPPMINVIFENGTSNTGVSEKKYRDSLEESNTYSKYYYTHPAFRDGSKVYNEEPYDIGGWDEELTGIWAGKFFMSKYKDDVYSIIPGANPVYVTNVSQKFIAAISIAGGTLNDSTGTVNVKGNNTYGLQLNTNTHVAKNTEWGAIAYLSQSKYGKMGNPDYNGEDKEIFPSNSLSFTGRSGSLPSSESNSYSYSYNDNLCLSSNTSKCTGEKLKNAGTGASTTGTIYGVYDMAGRGYEYTFGNLNNNVRISGFTVMPEKKYYDPYNFDNSVTNLKDKSIMGDAIWETRKWYSDETDVLNDNHPWTMRNSYYTHGEKNGIFAIYAWDGGAGPQNSFHVILIY